MRIYISGPMTGKPDLNEPLFRSTEERLREMGHEVFNPHSMQPKPSAVLPRLISPSIWPASAPKSTRLWCCPDGGDSPGATAEVAAALAIEIPCYAEHADGFYLRRGTLHQGDLDFSDKLEAGEVRFVELTV